MATLQTTTVTGHISGKIIDTYVPYSLITYANYSSTVTAGNFYPWTSIAVSNYGDPVYGSTTNSGCFIINRSGEYEINMAVGLNNTGTGWNIYMSCNYELIPSKITNSVHNSYYYTGAPLSVPNGTSTSNRYTERICFSSGTVLRTMISPLLSGTYCKPTIHITVQKVQ